MSRACATLVLFACIGGCGLAHERVTFVHPTPAHDTGPVGTDAAPMVFPDSGPIAILDAGAPPDAGSCTEYWRSLSRCPASTDAVLGASCDQEGETCGVHCCQPGPPIACVGGHWISATPDRCDTVDCAAPSPCGAGSCAAGRVCVLVDEAIRTSVALCVVPPAPMPSCSAAPPGALMSDMHTCLSCRCSDQPTGPVVALSCDCCDL
jgi:hypothetical protein